MQWNKVTSTLTPEEYNIITQVMAEVKDEVVESDRLQNEMLQGLGYSLHSSLTEYFTHSSLV